ncbi:diaminopimelate decarboxylase [Methanoplanus endosymbiosus]|uniref:Diaminopimelate decarboxylase n=1 Tax=Methanoplanus endosymbiosus TaxID=33865 RepID=A0A9E7PPX2_9EURY|nr:diaminopimelate decarboxylase [Methanoplanus endosymbiosus]UUX93850.1 diaminopimelate decarboxylase [Methanoplanus endosymbiosus]
MKLPKHLTIKDGHLMIGSHDCNALAESYGTPLYVTDEQRIRDNFTRYNSALKKHYNNVQMLYAAKANGNMAVLKTFADMGAGADVFSSGELHLALLAGMDPEKLLFNGSSKTKEDLELAVEKGVKVSIDSFDELDQLSEVAKAKGKEVEVSFRINPAIDVPTHPKIATGLATSKFGIPAEQILDAYRSALDAENVTPVGMHCHIGSQILDVIPFAKAAEIMVKIAGQLTDIGVKLKFIDIGGGLGIPYRHDTDNAPTPEEYADAVMPVFLEGIAKIGIKPELWVEPGRNLMGDTTILLTGVNSVKTAHKKFVNVDAGFNLLLRPAMYDSYHEVVVANKADQEPELEYTVTGPICESGDIIAADRPLPHVDRGDLIAVLDCGAYGYSMASQYNCRPRCPEIMVSSDRSAYMRRGETVIDILNTMVDLPWVEK